MERGQGEKEEVPKRKGRKLTARLNFPHGKGAKRGRRSVVPVVKKGETKSQEERQKKNIVTGAGKDVRYCKKEKNANDL